RRSSPLLALAAPAALGLGHASARGEAVAAPVDACAQVEDELAGMWDRDRRRAVAQALIDTGRGYAADVAAQVVDRLDAQADAWVELRGELCEQERSAGDDVAAREQLHLVMACLDRGRGELQALADALLADPDGLLDNAVAAAFRQQSVELCRRRPDLALRSPGTLSPARAASLSRLGARLDVLDALLKAGDHERGQARARGVLADARGLADDHAIAEALYLLGAFTAGRGHHEEAERWLFDAALMAERAGDLVTLARARTELVVVVGYRL
ncbi:MAG: hypothetical protein KC636_01645, partial [Myxococcales bacterium]|nr:hypothetical protein [Myxococcales bacterium]